MDHIDSEILEILRRSGRESFSAIGRTVDLSTNAVAARVRRMEADGVIVGYRAIVGEVDVTAPSTIEAYVDVRLREDISSEGFLAWSTADPAVRDAVHVTGPYDYLLRIVVSGTAELDRFLRRIKNSAGAAQTQTRIALSRHQ